MTGQQINDVAAGLSSETTYSPGQVVLRWREAGTGRRSVVTDAPALTCRLFVIPTHRYCFQSTNFVEVLVDADDDRQHAERDAKKPKRTVSEIRMSCLCLNRWPSCICENHASSLRSTHRACPSRLTLQRVAAAKKDWRCNRCDRMNSAEVAFVASVAVAKDTPSRARHRVGQHHMCRLALAVTAPDWATCVRMFTRAQSSRPPNPRIVSSAGFFKRGAGR